MSVCLHELKYTFEYSAQRLEEGVESPETGVTHSCELPRGFWEPILGPSL